MFGRMVMNGKKSTRKHKSSKLRKVPRRVAIVVLAAVAVLAVAFLTYASTYSRATPRAEVALGGSGDVAVTQTSTGYLFDGPGTDNALVFYPGGKVQCEAYAAQLLAIAQRGTDVFLVRMPLNFAFLNMDAADRVMADDEYHYQHWYVGGHSLGGAMAAVYAADHTSQLDGLVVLAAYPTKSLRSPGFRMLSVYGSEDGQADKLTSHADLRPDDYTEVVIQGGNHAQFAGYGTQDGDGTATISVEDQQEQTAEAVEEFTQAMGS